MKIINSVNVLISTVICLVYVNTLQIGIGGLKKNLLHKKSQQSPADPAKLDKDLPDIPIYFQGWLKYLHYTEKENSKPKAFYKNSEFVEQSKSNLESAELAKKDEQGFINIQSELNFYSILYKDTLNIYNSRTKGYTNTVDSLDLSYIASIPEDNHFIGGIKDFGKFNEGYCFKIEANIPMGSFTPTADRPNPTRSIKNIWILCVDTERDKVQLMNTMIQLKLKQQHANGIYLEVQNGKPIQKGEPSSLNQIKNTEFGSGSRNSTNDGYWILLQDWTQCTLKCGGGLQYQQLMCVPPKAGGKKCEGPAVRTRPCNTQACPQAQIIQKVASSPLANSNNSTLPVIVKMMSVSTRPQRYDKCYIKEGDVMMEKNDESTKSFGIKPKIPVRLVLNDKTVSAYIDDSLSNRVVTFVLKETEFVRISNDKKCFKLRNPVRSGLFCQLDSAGGEFVEEWDYDFNLFKNQCKRKQEKSGTLLAIPEEKKLEKEFKERVNQVKADIVMEMAEKNKEIVEQNEEVKYTKKVQQVQSTSMMALQKETKLEELLEKEEEAKETNETKELETLIQAEKKKEECLNKAIKERELENQMNIAKSHAEDAIKSIQEQTKKDIAKKRMEVKKKIAEMRKKQDRKKAALRSQIMTIRTTIAKKLNKISKNGNPDHCVSTATESHRDRYCSQNFSSDYIKFQDCKTVESFCYVCCENEFGDLHVYDRDKCYARCDATKTS